MATTNITLSDDNLLAEYVPLEKFKGVLEQRLAIGPDMLALLIRDGQIAEASPGAHFAIGGVWRTLKDSVAGRHALRLLIADLKPFQLSTSADALTKDNVPVAGEFTIELQVNPEKPANVLGLMKEHSAVTKTSVLDRLTPHLGDRVLNSAVRRVDAVELRGNLGMQDKIQADAMTEVERLASDIGLLVRAVSMRWGFNEEENALILKRQQEREQEALEREFTILNRSVEREGESTIMRLQTDLNVEKVKTSTEEELRRLILSNELGFIDARDSGVRIQQMKALEGELQLNRTNRLDGLKAQLEAEQHAIEMARTGGQRRAVGRDIEKDDRRHDVDLTKIGGEKRDVEMDIAARERTHDLAVIRIRADIRAVERSTEDLDKRQALALQLLEEMQQLKIAEEARKGQFSTMEGLERIALNSEAARLDHSIKAGDAEHQRKMEAARLAEESKLSTFGILKDATPEQILAINAGFSPQVANVLIEQAKSRSVAGTDQMALMREMIQQLRDNGVSNAAQAKDALGSVAQAAIGVAQGVGNAALGRNPAPNPTPPAMANTAPETIECPDCHNKILATDRFCKFCRRQMRQ